MDEVPRDQGSARHRAGRAAALLMAACLLASCTEAGRNRTAEPRPTASGSPTPSETPSEQVPGKPPSAAPPDTVPPPLPQLPATRDAAALTRQLDRAAATLRDEEASAPDVRRAAQFHQLAVRALAGSTDAFRRQVLADLHPATALMTRSDVTAALLLRGLTQPQRSLPRWRIVKPPPARQLLGYYRHAQRRTGVHWTYLAAIHLVETRMGRIRGTSTAGALGPMQFLPATWARYGAGGDINDPRDAILAAARLLRDNGAPGDMADALWHYNPSDAYVGAVSEHARTMRRSTLAYRGYWHWRVLYRHARGTYVLPVGYPDTRPVLLGD